MKNIFTYNIPDIMGEEERSKFFSSWDQDDLEYLAASAAEDFHSNRDGWEYRNWPIEIFLYEENGITLLGKFSVDRDVEPVFCARKMKQ